jgi:hypothetical protein
MTPREMIEVLEAFERGEQIEQAFKSNFEFEWNPFDGDFDPMEYTYRIAKPAPKKVKFLAWETVGGELVRFNDACPGGDDWKRVPSLDLEGEVEE